jgi:flagellar FliL protein
MAEEEGKGLFSKEKIMKIAKLLLIVSNLGVMAGGAGMIYVLSIGFELPAVTEAEERRHLASTRDERQENPVIYRMEKFTVNLNGKPNRFLRTKMAFEMLDERGFEEIVTLGAEARDTIITILNNKAYTDIETIQGKLFLKDEIMTKLNVLLDEGLIKEIYFGEFLVQ